MRVERICCAIFVSVCLFFEGAFIVSQVDAHSFSIDSIENYFNDISYKMKFIELYGGVQRILGKKQIENFTIFKNTDGKLIEPRQRLTNQQIEEKINEIDPIIEHLKETNTPYIYLTSMLPIQSNNELPVSVEDHSMENSGALLEMLYDRDYRVLNLRELESLKSLDRKERFYYTDHHWSMQACFNTYLELIDYINSEKLFSPAIERYERTDFENVIIPDSFLGSYGIKVGKYYSGKDDFSYMTPAFEAHLLFKRLSQKGEIMLSKEGTWADALMDQSLIENTEYNNKYAAFLNQSSVETRIINKDASNDRKLLLISHSYGRPLAQYLSLNFEEVRMLDPQEGRFNGNYIEYIDQYEPDIVVFLIEFEGEIIGKYRTSRES